MLVELQCQGFEPVKGGNELRSSGDEVKTWIYKSTAKKQYRLTDNQIKQAVASGLVEAKTRANPYYSSSPPSLLLKVADIERNLQQIKALPKYSDSEKARMKIYGERSRARARLSFYCPRCGRNIRAPRDSEMFEAYLRGEVSAEEAQKILMIAHYRHAHTDYETVLLQRYERYQELRDEGYDFDTAWMLVDDEMKDEDLKKKYNREAVELLKKDGLIQE
jgi:hypothetical protein